MKKILITGINGFLGSHVAIEALNKGLDVYGIDIANSNIKNPQIKFFQGSVDLDLLKNLDETFDIIIHCAGCSSVGASLNNPHQEFINTVNTTNDLLEYIRLYSPDSKLVYPSSAAVYGAGFCKPIKENSVLNPISPYGIYKKMVEELCFSYHKNFGIKVSLIRFFSLYGNNLKKQLLWDACNKFISGKNNIEFFGTGKEVRDWLHISDAVSLIFEVINYEGIFEIYNGGRGTPVSIEDILKELGSYLDKKITITYNNITKEGDPLYLCADMSKTTKINWLPEKKLSEGIKEYVEWFNCEKEKT